MVEETPRVPRQALRTFAIEAITTLQNVGEEGVGTDAEGVPENMRRYVWYYKAEFPYGQIGAAVGTVYERRAGVLTVKDQFVVTGSGAGAGGRDKKQHPEGTPEPEKPVLAFDTSGFIAVQTSSPQALGSGVVLMTFGYYDALPE